MLITKQQIIDACNLTPAQLNEAMLAGGFTDKYHTVTFQGMNLTGHYVYEVTGFDEVEGEDVAGKVYLKFERKAFSSKFTLVGDY